jgi:hypothetical protein
MRAANPFAFTSTAPRRLIVAAVAATLLALPAVPRAVAGAAAAQCDTFDVSPAFAHDHSLACAARGRQSSVLSVSQDAGRSWRSIAVTYVGAIGNPDVYRVAFSPAYAADHTLYLHTSAGLFSATDLSGTFLPADLLATNNAQPFSTLTPYLDTTAGTAAFAYADQHQAARISPPAGHQAVPGATPDLTNAFLMPPAVAVGDEVLALGIHVDGSARPALYGCTWALSCSLRYTFPPSTALGAWLSPAYRADKTVIVETVSAAGLTFYRSVDQGRTFAPWSAVNRALASTNHALLAHGGSLNQPAALVWDPSNARRLYLRLTAYSGRGGPPFDQVFRSDDRGATWHRVAYGVASGLPGRGTVPWNGTFTVQSPIANANLMRVAPDGRLFALGVEVVGGGYDGIYCSLDHGVHWARTCAR